MSRAWVRNAIEIIERDYQRSADTHLIRLDLPGAPDVHIYLKDESTHITGSLKHRLARSLFLWGLCGGSIDEGTTLVEASSGSTAVSEAYFARLLGLPFIAVIPAGTSEAKIAQIAFYGGRCHFVEDGSQVYAEAERLARETRGFYLDQFTNAAQATDWRGNNNVAESIFAQMSSEPYPEPEWIVVGAGTGGTSSTIGRYLRYKGHPGSLCVVDPENSVFFDHFMGNDRGDTPCPGSGIEGIGRPRVEPSFNPCVIDRMIRVTNAQSYAGMHFLAEVLGRKYGGSTGTNLYGVFVLAAEMVAAGRSGSIVTLACDPGERYLDTYYDHDWLAREGYDLAPEIARFRSFYETGVWGEPALVS